VKRISSAMSVILAVLLVGASSNALAQPSDYPEFRGVQEMANRWVQAYNRHDRNALGALYARDAKLMMHGAPTISGRNAIEEFWADDFQAGDPLTVLTVTHAVEGSDMILVHGNYQVINREDGTQVGMGRFAHIWLLDGGEWRLDRDMWNRPFEPYRP
jgi:uncharacterized protein (TIGR02246 family)